MDIMFIPDTIRFGRELTHPGIASAREYLMTYRKAYSSSSFAGNSRRSHGLFVDQERIILSSLHETINGISLLRGWWGDRPVHESVAHLLSARMYPVTEEFSLGSALVTRTLELDQGLRIRWEITGTADVEIRPLMIDRSIHDPGSEHQILVEPVQGGYDWNGYQFRCTLPFTSEEHHYFHAWYPLDGGYDDQEDLFSPGVFAGTITNDIVKLGIYPGGTCHLRTPPAPLVDLINRASLLCIQNGEIIAGYHGLTPGIGRDTFISMPGLLLAYDRYHQAEDLFRRYLRHRNGGLIPDRYPDTYNSADVSLWFFWALFQYLQTQQNSPFVDGIIPDLESLIMSYPETAHTSMERDLISVSAGSTWMDSRYIPREGKPVEINALWVLALEVCEYLEISVPVSSKQVRRSFYSFWNEGVGCLYDVLDPDDPAVRPNQLIALALGLVPFDEGRRALETIQNTLLTPYGPRTLAPGSPGYQGIYAGDAPCHNGMVCPWLMAWYTDALIQYGEHPRHVSRVLHPLSNYFMSDGCGMIPELFDGDFPYTPRGAVCHALSTGEFIRARNTILSLQETRTDE